MNVLVAVDAPVGDDLAAGLRREGIAVVGVVEASALLLLADDGALGEEAERIAAALTSADTVVLGTTRRTLTASVVALCDRSAVRIIALCERSEDERIAAAFGVDPALALDVQPWRLAEVIASPGRDGVPSSRADAGAPPTPAAAVASSPKVIAVWGPGGAPGRSTIAIELAVELARGGRHVGLVDADSHAPSIALLLGMADEAPGFAAACRQAELGGLDARELTRISAPLSRTGVDVLTGINRPSRWPELTAARVAAALTSCRDWADYTVVDVAAPLERDEEIVSDLDGPRRNAATLAALQTADLVVAVAGADPLGVSRFLRAYPELRATIGATPVAVLANRLRPGALGIDARGQVRRTLDRFGGIDAVSFVPSDPRSADAALLAARPIAEVSPRSPIALGVRRFVGESVAPTVELRTRSRRALRVGRTAA
ncbi:AAA family ATPase [Microbacterium pygmaeum]|uniref:MinD-like ATPase involved in chromosome partitioning or flagellar assembly n=1 Tax=Microbacterium pygmaeum TaxID=370764 RepID=A0A1G8CKE9_9MICO|nr:P-loop NTPase [Microbacterium pygmaeum]SDH46017.1 MinD-like ATPase involved in chromosome partitioning or flagellar assembly [Microbacterium pygmaeum]